MRRRVLFIEVMHVVCRHDFDVMTARKTHKMRKHGLLVANVMVLNFYIIIFAEKRLVSFDNLVGGVHVPPEDCLGQFARKTGRKTNKSLGVFFKVFKIRARFVIKSVDVSDADQFYKVFIARHVFGKQHQVIVLGHFAVNGSLYVHIVGHVYFAAYYGFDLKLPFFRDKPERVRVLVRVTDCSLYKLQRTVHIAVVGNCDRGHTKLVAAAENTGNARSSVKQAVFGMNVKMNEFFH